MKLLLLKNNHSRFTMDYQLADDNVKVDLQKYIEFDKNISECNFMQIVFEDGQFEYENIERNGIIYEQNSHKFIFEIKDKKIVNKYNLQSNIEISKDHILQKCIFAYDKNIKDLNAVKRKFEINLRVEIMNKLDQQIQSLMSIKGRLQIC